MQDYKKRADNEALKLFNDKELLSIYNIAINAVKNNTYRGEVFSNGASLYKAVLNYYKSLRIKENLIYKEIESIKDNDSKYYKDRVKNLEVDLINIIKEMELLQ